MRISFIKSIAFGFGCLAFAGCHESPQPSAQQKTEVKAEEPLRAAVFTVELRQWPTIARCQGSLVADDQTLLGSRVAGLVKETFVDVGDKVEPGQTLVALDDSEFKLQLAAAEAALLQARALIGLKPGDPVSKLDPLNAPPVREAKATLDETRSRRERWEKLRNQNAVAEEEFQTLVAADKVAEARYASALNGVNSNIAQVAVRTAEVDLARQRIKDSTIVAPFGGFVQQRLVAAGTFVQIGTPLVSLVQIDALRFRGTLPERLAGRLQIGQTVRLSIESVEDTIEAKVTRINPGLDMASRSLTFEALIDNSRGNLRAGLFAEAEVTIDPDAKAVVIHESSLLEFAGSQKTWKIVDGTAKEQVVRPGRRSQKMVEILDGLSAGDQILVNATLGRVAKVEPEGSDKSATRLATSPAATGSAGTGSAKASADGTLEANKAQSVVPPPEKAKEPAATVDVDRKTNEGDKTPGTSENTANQNAG